MNNYLIEFKYEDNVHESEKEFDSLLDAVTFINSNLHCFEYWGIYQLIDDDWELIADDLNLLYDCFS